MFKMSPLAPSMFQSTLPHGERPKVVLITFEPPCFNPRSRTGSDWTFCAF